MLRRRQKKYGRASGSGWLSGRCTYLAGKAQNRHIISGVIGQFRLVIAQHQAGYRKNLRVALSGFSNSSNQFGSAKASLLNKAIYSPLAMAMPWLTAWEERYSRCFRSGGSGGYRSSCEFRGFHRVEPLSITISSKSCSVCFRWIRWNPAASQHHSDWG